MSTGYNQLQIEEELKVDGSLDTQVLSSSQMKMQRTDPTEVCKVHQNNCEKEEKNLELIDLICLIDLFHIAALRLDWIKKTFIDKKY